MRRHFGIATALFVFAAIAPAPAWADGITVSGTLTLNALDGTHDTGTAIDRLNFVPLPLGEIDARHRATSLHLEGIPPLTFAYGSAGSVQSTRLSIVNVALRQTLRWGAFIGLGQTIYNQRTFFSPPPSGITSQGSRVTGVRLELGADYRVVGATHGAFVFAFNPAMHGVEKTQLRAFALPAEIDDPERAVQVDTSFRFVTMLRRGDVIYGVRYLNYASRFDLRGTTADGLLADRNVGFLPFIGYRVRL